MLAWSVDPLAEHGLSASEHRNPIPDAPQNLTELYDAALADDPNRIAVVGRSGALSFAALEAEVNAACAYFGELRMRAGDRVAVSLANDIHIVVAFLAVPRVRGILVGIHR